MLDHIEESKCVITLFSFDADKTWDIWMRGCFLGKHHANTDKINI